MNSYNDDAPAPVPPQLSAASLNQAGSKQFQDSGEPSSQQSADPISGPSDIDRTPTHPAGTYDVGMANGAGQVDAEDSFAEPEESYGPIGIKEDG